MKKKIFYLASLVIMLFAFTGCSQSTIDDGGDEEGKKSVVINCNIKDGDNFTAGNDVTITCSLENSDIQNPIYNFKTSDTSVIDVIGGKLVAKKAGSAKLTVSVEGLEEIMEININVINPSFEVNFNDSYDYDLNENEIYKLIYSLSDEKSIVASLGFTFDSSNKEVCTINENGEIRTLKEGKSTITVTSKWDASYKYTVEVNVLFDPLAIMASYNIEEPLYQNVKTFGATEITQMVMGSVNYYSPMDLNLVENIIPITDNCPYAGQTATEELLEKAEKANKYMRTGILHTETTKITYHDTGNNSSGANALMHAKYLVSAGNQQSRARSWHYTVDEKEVIHHIPDNEVSWQGDNYLAYSTSIGIETCVDQGSELDITWHRVGKLMASLIKKYNLTLDDVVQHFDWSGKNCPQTLRMNNLYPYAKKMIEAELAVITKLEGYEITFTSLNPELVDNNGHIIAIPATATEVAYVITAKNNDGYNKSRVVYTTIPGKDGTKSVKKVNTNIHEFYDSFNSLTIDNFNDSFALYEKLNNEEKSLATGVNFLLDTIKGMVGGTAPKLSIEEVYYGNKLRYQFILLKNNTNAKIALTSYSISYTDSFGERQTFGFPQKSIEAGSYYLIYCGINDSVDPDEVLYPDFALDLDLSNNGKLAIYKSDDKIDEIEYDTSVIRVGYSKDMDKDLAEALINPTNSLGEKYQEIDNVNNNVIDFEYYALSINLPLTKDQSSKIASALEFYSGLDPIEKSKTRSNSYLKSLKTKCDALK